MAGNLILNNVKYAYSESESLQKSSQFKSYSGVLSFISEWKSGKPSFQLHTSGSTGKPKAIMLTREQMIFSANRTIKALNLKQGASALMCMNPSFVGGKMMLVRALAFNWDLKVIPPNADPSSELTINDDFDFAAMVPMQIENMLTSEKGLRILNQIKTIIVGGAPVSLQLREQLQSLKSSVYNTYGMTETVSHIALMPLNGENQTDQFRLLEGVTAALDQRACLSVKADVTNHEWVQTNDVVTLDDNQFKWLGRADFVINSGGIKLHLDQLQATISTLLAAKSMLVKINDQLLGETYTLVLLNNVNSSEAEILSFLKSKLPKYHAPKSIVLMNEFPRTQSGKVDYQKLKKDLGL
jgi:O-succinylbenzoic acid--CoA ligase